MPDEHVPDLFIFSSGEKENILVLPGRDARSNLQTALHLLCVTAEKVAENLPEPKNDSISGKFSVSSIKIVILLFKTVEIFHLFSSVSCCGFYK